MSAECSPAVTCEAVYKKCDLSIDLRSLTQLTANLDNPAIIGANAAKARADRFSYWSFEPQEIFEFQSQDENPFEKLNAVLNKYVIAESSPPDELKAAFCGGWMGFFSYELCRYIEKVPQHTVDDLKMPLIRLCFYDKLICYDHKLKTFWLIALNWPGSQSPDKKFDRLNDLIRQTETIHIQQKSPPLQQSSIDLTGIKSNMSKERYLDTVNKIKRYIFDGEVYQINFSHRFQCQFKHPAVDLFHWQNQHNPCGYSAYIGAEDYKIVSASPEMFINLHGGIIQTKPIKGTRPRQNPDTQQINHENYLALLHSEKERAELNMIIDLERNDLGRICEYGTIKLTQPRTIEEYPSVFHAVATVRGKIRPSISFCDILKAMFPGGSITGAPKVRAMEIIDEIEPTARGVYTGSIGWIGLDGNASLNIAIRTIIIRDQKAYVQTGGGIVADSEPQSEWHETLVKAKALLAGIQAINDG